MRQAFGDKDSRLQKWALVPSVTPVLEVVT